jgi:hypothetical protein
MRLVQHAEVRTRHLVHLNVRREALPHALTVVVHSSGCVLALNTATRPSYRRGM